MKWTMHRVGTTRTTIHRLSFLPPLRRCIATSPLEAAAVVHFQIILHSCHVPIITIHPCCLVVDKICIGNTRATRRTLTSNSTCSRPTGLSGFFFGFMYEEECSVVIPEDDERVQLWNRLNWDLIVVYSCTTAATAVPYTLVFSAATEFGASSAALVASRATACSVLGCACGKLLLGPAGDVFGARRVSATFAMLGSISLWLLSVSPNETCAVWACFAVECCQSVQWPCIMIILASHYNLQHSKHYEGGIYVTSLASRCASLLTIPLSFAVLQKTSSWRVVAVCGALVSLTGAIVMYLFVSDSPTKRNHAQNPIPTKLLQDFYQTRKTCGCLAYLQLMQRVLVSQRHSGIAYRIKEWHLLDCRSGSYGIEHGENVGTCTGHLFSRYQLWNSILYPSGWTSRLFILWNNVGIGHWWKHLFESTKCSSTQTNGGETVHGVHWCRVYLGSAGYTSSANTTRRCLIRTGVSLSSHGNLCHGLWYCCTMFSNSGFSGSHVWS